MDELQAGAEFALTVLPQAPAFFQPGEETLHDPALGYHSKGVQLIALGSLHRRTQPVFDGLGKRLSRVTYLDQHTLDLLQVRCTPVQRLKFSPAVSHIGRHYRHRMRQSLGVHSDVALDARDLLARVVALVVSTVRVLHTSNASTIKKLVLELRSCPARTAPI